PRRRWRSSVRPSPPSRRTRASRAARLLRRPRCGSTPRPARAARPRRPRAARTRCAGGRGRPRSVRGRLPAFERRWVPVRSDRARTLDPGAELGLWELGVLLLQEDPVGVATLEVFDEHLACDLVLAALRNREVDLEERVRVAVEHGGHAVLLE